MAVRRRWAVVVAGLGVLVGAFLWVASPAARTGDRGGSAEPGIAVAMGDSFISGEGGRWLGNSQDALGDRDGTDRAAVGCRGSLCRSRDPHRVYGETQDNGCHRSDVAPILSAVAEARGLGGDGGLTEAVNLACSGAETKHLWRASRGVSTA